MSFRLSNKMPNESRRVEEKIEAKKKYFFVLEGEKTEDIYIRELSQHLREDALADIVLLERVESTESNQYKITYAINAYLNQSLKIKVDQKARILDLCNRFDKYELNEQQLIDGISDVLGELSDDFIKDYHHNVIEQIRLLNELIKYEKGFDKDPANFIANRRITKSKSSKKYTEHTLNEEMKKFGLSYQKNSYDAQFFVKRFSVAHLNSTHYAVTNRDLKELVGTSVPAIIKDLL